MDHQGGEVRVVSAAVLAQLQAAGFQVQFCSQISLISSFFISLTLIQIMIFNFFFFVHKKQA